MQHLKIRCEGRTPIFMDQYTPDGDGTTPGHKKDSRPVDEIAADCLWTSIHDGKTIVIPGDALFRCILDGGRFYKRGKALWTNASSSQMPGVMEWYADEVPLEHNGWHADTRAIVTKAGGRLPKIRPVFPEWSFTFGVGIDTGELDEGTFRSIVDSAGRRIGIGCWRPEKKGMMGQFVVTGWNRVNKPFQNRVPGRKGRAAKKKAA